MKQRRGKRQKERMGSGRNDWGEIWEEQRQRKGDVLQCSVVVPVIFALKQQITWFSYV